MFEAAEIGLEAFGHNIENRHLIAALDRRAPALPQLTRIEAAVAAVEPDDAGVTIRLDDGGAVTARLVVGADGRKSLCRAAAGIETERRELPAGRADAQSRPRAAAQRHLDRIPHRERPVHAGAAARPALQPRLRGRAGRGRASRARSTRPRCRPRSSAARTRSSARSRSKTAAACFRSRIETARSFARNRIALVGEAAHVIPPIGAQGLNLGLRDAATIGELVVEARRDGADVGAPDCWRATTGCGARDVTSRTVAVDVLNRSLLSDFLPVQGARGFGLYLLDRIAPLRRAVMREGVEPAAQPRLMRGEAL